MPDTGDGTDAPAVNEETESWLADRVDDTDRTVAEELERIVALYRLAVENGERAVEAPADVAEILALPEQLDRTRAEFKEEIEDVRERVIQVLEETYSRARKDHSHPAIESEVAHLNSIRTDVDSTAASIQELERKLEEIDARNEDADGKLETVANAVVRLRERVDQLEANVEIRERTDDLRREANRVGARVADCGQRSRSVTVSLLTAPRCPHCEATFNGIDPASGFFGSATLQTEMPPALDGETAPDETDTEANDSE